jgi:prepilin-type processing-associated H-X9-DG protein
VIFADNILALPNEPKGWHRAAPAGNVALLDGHIESHTALSVTNLVW